MFHFGTLQGQAAVGSGAAEIELVRTYRGADNQDDAVALSVGPFTPGNGDLIVAFWLGFRSGTSTPAPVFTGGSLAWTPKTLLIHATSLDWDPVIQVATAVSNGGAITVTCPVTGHAHRHSLVVVSFAGHNGSGAYGTATYTAPTGDLAMTLDEAATAGSQVIAATILRNWVGTASAIGIAANGTELYRHPSVNGSEVDEQYVVAQAITGWTTDTQAVVWDDVNGNDSNSNQGMAAVALEVLLQTGPAIDPTAAAWAEASSGEQSPATIAALSAYLTTLKAANLFDRLDWLSLLAADGVETDSQPGRLNICNLQQSMTVVNSVTWTNGRGVAGNAVDSYVHTGGVYNNTGNSYALNSAAAGAYCNVGGTGAGTGSVAVFGVAGAVNTIRVTARTSAGNSIFQAHDAGTTDVFEANTGSRLGHRGFSRESSVIKRGYRNGTQTADLTTVSSSVPAGNAAIGRNNAVYNDDRFGLFHYGGAMTAAEWATFATATHTLMTALGANY